MDNNWFITLFSFLFKKGPNNTYCWWFNNFIVYNDYGEQKIYCFLTKETYINDNFRHKIESDVNAKLIDSKREIENLQNNIYQKTDLLKHLQRECESITNKHSKALNENISNNRLISMLETKVTLYVEKINELALEKVVLKDDFDNELGKKDKVIESLRGIINEDRERQSKNLLSIEEKHLEQIKLLSKQIEYLDIDFVNVAKAMRIYNKEAERPIKGYRIKLNG